MESTEISDPVAAATPEIVVLPRRPLYRRPLWRVWFFICGLILPAACCGLAAAGFSPLIHPWQSGQIDVYAGLMLQGWPLAIFLPLMLLSMLCLARLCIWPASDQWTVIRVGIFGGAWLSIQFFLLAMLSLNAATVAMLIAACVVGPLLMGGMFLISLVLPQAKRVTIFQLMLLTTLVAIPVAVLTSLSGGVEALFGGTLMALFWICAATPLLNLFTYTEIAYSMLAEWRRSRKLEYSLLGAWIIAWLASIKLAIDATLADYTSLPTTAPNCYISSAAAHGHPDWVGSRSHLAELEQTGRTKPTFPVNLQMCRLKFLELCLIVLAPRLAHRLRRLYDRLGPYAAHLCQRNRWFADFSYLMLKPFEWFAEGLRKCLRIPLGTVRELY